MYLCSGLGAFNESLTCGLSPRFVKVNTLTVPVFSVGEKYMGNLTVVSPRISKLHFNLKLLIFPILYQFGGGGGVLMKN